MNTPSGPIDDDPLPARIQDALDQLPAATEPQDVSMIDGFICGVLLQPEPIVATRWQPMVIDPQGQPVAAGLLARSRPLFDLLAQRHAELDAAIGGRQWFDPWVYEFDDAVSPSDSVLPWVAGFALALEHFPRLMALESPELLEPLALLYRHFDPDDLEDAEALLEQIEEIEPAADLAEAVEDLVRSVMLLADVSRPQILARPSARPAGTPARPRSRSGNPPKRR